MPRVATRLALWKLLVFSDWEWFQWPSQCADIVEYANVFHASSNQLRHQWFICRMSYTIILGKKAMLDILAGDTWKIPCHFICHGLRINTSVGTISLIDNRGLSNQNRCTTQSKLISGLTQTWHDPNGMFDEWFGVNLVDFFFNYHWIFLDETIARSGNKAADHPTVELSCHMQNCDLIGSFELESRIRFIHKI